MNIITGSGQRRFCTRHAHSHQRARLLTVAVTAADCVGDDVLCAVVDADPEGDMEDDADAEEDDVRELVGVPVSCAELVGVLAPLLDGVRGGDVVGVVVFADDTVRDDDAPAVTDVLAELEGEGVPALEFDCVADVDGVLLEVRVFVGVRVLVLVGELVRVLDGVCVVVVVGLLEGETTYCTASSLKLNVTCS